MNQSDETRICRWIDGELREEDIRDLLDADPSIYELRESAADLGQLLRAEYRRPELPYADFFNSRILRHIEEEREEADAGVERIVIRVPRLVTALFANQGLIPGLAFAAVLLLALGTFLFGGNPGSRHSQVVHTFAPDPGTSVKATYNGRAGASVITIDGISPLERDASLFTYHHPEMTPGETTQTVMHRQESPLHLASASSYLASSPLVHPLLQLR